MAVFHRGQNPTKLEVTTSTVQPFNFAPVEGHTVLVVGRDESFDIGDEFFNCGELARRWEN